MKFSIKDFFNKCDKIRSFLRIWSHLLKKSLLENIIFCAVNDRIRKHTSTKQVFLHSKEIFSVNLAIYEKSIPFSFFFFFFLSLSRLVLISSMRLDGKKDIQCVKSVQ